MHHTEPPTDKTIHEWYIKFQQSGCLCAAKRTGRLGPSAETVERVRETFVRIDRGRTEIWSVSPSVDMFPPGVTIPATVPQRSKIPEGLMNFPVFQFKIDLPTA